MVKLKKLFSSIGFVAVLLLGCINFESRTLQLTSTPTNTHIPTIYSTNTSTPTITVTPTPVVIEFNKIQNLSIVNSLEIDQSQFVTNTFSDFNSRRSNVPEGDVQDAYFVSHITLDTGETIGIQIIRYANCKIFNPIYMSTECLRDRVAVSAVNLSKGEILWTQDINLYVDNEFFSIEVDKKKGTVTIPTPDAIIIKEIESGENLVEFSTIESTYNPYIAALSPDSKKLVFAVIGRNLNTVFVHDMVSFSSVFKYNIVGKVSDFEWASDSSLLAIGKSNGGIDVINLESYKVETVIDTKKVLETGVEDPPLIANNASYFFYNPNYGVFRLKFSEDKKRLGFIETYFLAEEFNEVNKLNLLNLETRIIENKLDASFQGTGEIIWSSNDEFLITLSDEPKFEDRWLYNAEEIPSIDKILFMNSNDTQEFLLPEAYTEAETSRFLELSSSSLLLNNEGTLLTVIRSGFSRAFIYSLQAFP